MQVLARQNPETPYSLSGLPEQSGPDQAARQSSGVYAECSVCDLRANVFELLRFTRRF